MYVLHMPWPSVCVLYFSGGSRKCGSESGSPTPPSRPSSRTPSRTKTLENISFTRGVPVRLSSIAEKKIFQELLTAIKTKEVKHNQKKRGVVIIKKRLRCSLGQPNVLSAWQCLRDAMCPVPHHGRGVTVVLLLLMAGDTPGGMGCAASSLAQRAEHCPPRAPRLRLWNSYFSCATRSSFLAKVIKDHGSFIIPPPDFVGQFGRKLEPMKIGDLWRIFPEISIPYSTCFFLTSSSCLHIYTHAARKHDLKNACYAV